MRVYKIFTNVALIVLILITQVLGPILNVSHAVATNGLASPWTREKASYLASRVLFGPTPAKIDELYNAGSASSAVDILFPNQIGPDRTQYNAAIGYFTGSNFTLTTGFPYASENSGNAYMYYFYRYYIDPYESKAKLSTLFEDTFAVNVQEGIRFKDVQNLHNLLYSYSLGNYKTLIKRVVMNNQVENGDYAPSQFLNLLRQYNKDNPNENYARELLQLFLMGEYLPEESKDNGDIRNYEESDVASLAKVITGFWSDSYFPYDLNIPGNVYYTGTYHNTSSGVTFLAGNTGGVSFPFYDTQSDALNLSNISTPILGNNGLGDNTIDYIFAKRSHAIALFLANKFYHFYIHEHPTRGELEIIANQLEANNFEILPTIKWLLASDMMYTDTAMNAMLFKNPLELTIGLFKLLHSKDDPYSVDWNFYTNSLLTSLEWTPYFPGSIFGRDGFDRNADWINANVMNKWSNEATSIVYNYTRTGVYLINNIVPTQTGMTMDQFITTVQDNLLLGRELPLSVKNQIKTYLTTSETGAIIQFQPTNVTYTRVKYPGVFSLVLTQPEYILKSGYDLLTESIISEPSKIQSATGKLIIIELPGGYDWWNGIIQKSDYANYVNYRTDGSGNTIAHTLSELTDLGDYYMDNYLAYSGGNQTNGPAFKDLYDQGYLKIFNRVGTSKHSRDHNQARNQIASIDNTTTGQGLIGELTKNESSALNTIVLGSSSPFIFAGGNYMNIGAGDNRIVTANPSGNLNTNQRNQQVVLRIATLTGRTYPGKLASIYGDAKKIHDIAQISVSQGGQSGVGYTTSSNLQFLSTLLNNDAGRIFYLANGGNGYDSHSNELSGSTNVSQGAGKMAYDVANFFRQIKDTQNVTIVIYSEFGRTTRVNGTVGTDHGNGGGMFVLTSNPELKTYFGSGIYGKIKTALERDNWQSDGIDYRSIYGKILSFLFATPESNFFKKYSSSLDNDLSEKPSKFALMRNEYIATSDTVMKVSTKYGVEDANFDVDKGSYAISTFGTGADSQKIFTSPFMTYANWWGIIKNTTKNEYDFNPVNWPTYKTFAEKTPFVFSLTAVNNQYATTTYTGVITLPDILPSSINQVVTTGDSVLRKYANTYVFSTGTILAGSGIILSNSATGITKFNGRGGVSMETQTGATYIVSLDSATGTMNWNGGFIIGEDIATGTFLPTYATVTDMGLDLKEFHVDKLVRIGSDVLGIGMQLSQPVSISFTGISPDTTYTLLTSEDGIHWSRHSTPQVTTTSSGTVIFSTDHFSLFALTEEPPTPLCNLSINPTPIANGTQATFSWTTLNASGITLNNGIGNVTSYGVQSGSMLSIPPVNSTTEYILTATNPYGSASCKATVITKAPPSCSVASDVTDIKNGGHVLLSWTGMHTDTGFLIPNNINIPSIGNITTIPPMNTTTNYTLQVSNDVGTSSCSTVITTYPNSAPIAQDDIVGTTQNISNFFPILENDIDSNTGDSIVVKDIVSQASHGIAEIAGSTIHYTPTPAYCGTDTFMYRIQDNDGAVSNTATVTVNISCGTNAPVVDSLAFSGTEDANITSTLSGSDADGDPIQFHLLVGTASGTVVSTGLTQSTVHGSVTLATDGSFVYTPNPNFNGSDSFLYTATDGYYSGNTATAVLTVLSVNDAPIAVSDSGSTNKDITTVIHILANDIDPDHAILSLTPTIISQPISGTITLSGLTNASGVSLGTVAYYTPYSGYCGGQDSFTYRLTDGSGTVSIPTIVTVDVMCTNDPPTAINDTVILNEDTSFNINSLINDTDQNIVQGPSFITGEILRIDGITASPLYGTAVIVPNSSPIGGNSGISSDSIMYTPNSNYCGTDMLSYRTRDSMGNISNSAMVMITIICINDVPTSQSLTLSGVVNLESTNPLILTGLLQVADIDHSTGFTYALTTTPVFGTASIQNTTGMFSYTPILGFTGTETLPFTVTDASGGVSSVRYITVLYTSAPQIVSFSGTITSSTGQVSLLSGSTKTSLPSGYTLDLTGRTITAISRPVDLGFSGSSTISGTNLLPGSIVIPGTTKITVDGGIWSGEILAPTKIASNQSEHIILTDSGVSAALPINTSTMTYTYTPVDTIKAGSTGASLALSGGNATIEYIVNSPGIVFGSTLRILRSQDGNTWVPNFPDTACIIDNEMKCTFQTNHLTYFGIVEVISTPIQTSIIASAGAGGYSPYIPTGGVSMNGDINSMDRVSSSNIVTFSGLLLPDAFAKSQKKNIADSNIGVNGSSMNEIQTDLQPNDTQIITYSTLYSRKQVLFVKKYRGIYSDQFMTNIIFWSILRNYSGKSERTDVVKSIKDDLYSLSVTNPAISSVDLSQDASYNDSYLNVADLIENLWEKKKPKMK